MGPEHRDSEQGNRRKGGKSWFGQGFGGDEEMRQIGKFQNFPFTGGETRGRCQNSRSEKRRDMWRVFDC